VVIEDSATGMLAAQNAAMRCYAFVPDGQVAPDNVFDAHRFNAMQDLPALLGFT